LYREKLDEIYKFMSVETGRGIARDLSSWLPKIRLEFALQGEPLLNKNAYTIFQIFREEFPKCQIMVTTNTDPLRQGKGFNQEKIKKLFLFGVNIVVADYYGEKDDMSYEEFVDGFKQNTLGIPVHDIYKDKPTIWGYVGYDVSYIVTIDNTMDRDFTRNLNNQAGNTSPELIKLNDYSIEPLPLMKRCHLPFREMAIRHDGTVPLCCMDWQKEKIMGKFPETSLKDIWEGSIFKMTRSLLFNKRRDLLNPCDRCNYHPVKVGLVEDPYPKGHPDVLITAKSLKKGQEQFKNLKNKYADLPFDYTKVTAK